MLLLLLGLARAGECDDLAGVPQEGAVVATVDGIAVHQSAVAARMASLPAAFLTPEHRADTEAKVVDQLVLEELLVAEACRRELPVRADVGARLIFAQREALGSALLDDEVARRTTPEAIAGWYTAHQAQFARAQVKASHILVKTRPEALAVKRRLDGGADFAGVAREVSVDAGSAPDGGELGWFEKSRMVPEFAEAAFSGAEGALVGPVETKFGWHLIRVEGRRDTIPLEEAHDRVVSAIEDEVTERFLAELRAAHSVVR